MTESKQAPTPGPDDTVRVSRRTAETALSCVKRLISGDAILAAEELRTALSTPPASPDAGRVERVQHSLKVFEAGWLLETGNANPTGRNYVTQKFLVMLDAALATPSAPEDAKGEGVNELAKRIYTAWSKDERFVRDVPGSPQAYFWAEIAARAAAGNTERK